MARLAITPRCMPRSSAPASGRRAGASKRSKAHASLWNVAPEAADADAEEGLKQALALHRKMRALNRELKSAEAALAQEGSETNLARLRDIQEQLSALAGTEAAVEGFGVASGRPSGTL